MQRLRCARKVRVTSAASSVPVPTTKEQPMLVKRVCPALPGTIRESNTSWLNRRERLLPCWIALVEIELILLYRPARVSFTLSLQFRLEKFIRWWILFSLEAQSLPESTWRVKPLVFHLASGDGILRHPEMPCPRY